MADARAVASPASPGGGMPSSSSIAFDNECPKTDYSPTKDDYHGTRLNVTTLRVGIAGGLAAAAAAVPWAPRRFSVLGFDACLMSSYEVISNLAAYSQFYVGSETLEPNDGWGYRAWLGGLYLRPYADGLATGNAAVGAFIALAAADGSNSDTMALIDARAWPAFDAAFDAALTALTSALGSPGAVIRLAAARAALADVLPADPTLQTTDVADFLASAYAAVAAAPGDAAAASALAALQAALTALAATQVAYEGDSNTVGDAGMSLYFPRDWSRYNPEFDEVDQVSTWRKYLRDYHNAAEAIFPVGVIVGQGPPRPSSPPVPFSFWPDVTAAVPGAVGALIGAPGATPLQLTGRLLRGGGAVGSLFYGLADVLRPTGEGAANATFVLGQTTASLRDDPTAGGGWASGAWDGAVFELTASGDSPPLKGSRLARDASWVFVRLGPSLIPDAAQQDQQGGDSGDGGPPSRAGVGGRRWRDRHPWSRHHLPRLRYMRRLSQVTGVGDISPVSLPPPCAPGDSVAYPRCDGTTVSDAACYTAARAAAASPPGSCLSTCTVALLTQCGGAGVNASTAANALCAAAFDAASAWPIWRQPVCAAQAPVAALSRVALRPRVVAAAVGGSGITVDPGDEGAYACPTPPPCACASEIASSDWHAMLTGPSLALYGGGVTDVSRCPGDPLSRDPCQQGSTQWARDCVCQNARAVIPIWQAALPVGSSCSTPLPFATACPAGDAAWATACACVGTMLASDWHVAYDRAGCAHRPGALALGCDLGFLVATCAHRVAANVTENSLGVGSAPDVWTAWVKYAADGALGDAYSDANVSDVQDAWLVSPPADLAADPVLWALDPDTRVASAVDPSDGGLIWAVTLRYVVPSEAIGASAQPVIVEPMAAPDGSGFTVVVDWAHPMDWGDDNAVFALRPHALGDVLAAWQAYARETIAEPGARAALVQLARSTPANASRLFLAAQSMLGDVALLRSWGGAFFHPELYFLASSQLMGGEGGGNADGGHIGWEVGGPVGGAAVAVTAYIIYECWRRRRAAAAGPRYTSLEMT